MREILFRGKCVQVGIYHERWIEGFYGEDDGKALIAHNTDLGMVGYFCDPDTIGQYTGLTDKNGTRIFEGDIIKQVIPHNLVQPFIFTVNWCEECAMFVLPCITNDAFESDFTVMRSDEIEVVGNIHDNPELLKGD